MPEYAAQPGTVVLGGARPPPQSRNSQVSPVSGTYQMRDVPAGEIAVEETQPERSVRAKDSPERTAKRRKQVKVDEAILDNITQQMGWKMSVMTY